MEKEFKRVRTAQDIIVSLVIVAAGCGLVIPNSISIQIVGFILILTGVVLFLILRSGYRLAETGEIYKKKEKYFAQSMKDSVCKAVASDPDSLNVSEEDKGNGLRIDTYYSTKLGKAWCQVLEYIPYRYEPCSPFYEYDLTKADKLIK